MDRRLEKTAKGQLGPSMEVFHTDAMFLDAGLNSGHALALGVSDWLRGLAK
jgi:hypothetical protein